MTIIVVRDGVMAADRQMTKGDVVYGYRDKIVRLSNGTLYAGAGRGQDVIAFGDWLEDQCLHKPNIHESFRGISMWPNGSVFEYGPELVPEPYDQPYYYVGGEEEEIFVAGALAMGATAAQAVKLCIQYCLGAGGDVQIETISGDKNVSEAPECAIKNAADQ